MLRRLVDQTKVAIIVDTSLDSSPGSFVHEEDASRGLLAINPDRLTSVSGKQPRYRPRSAQISPYVFRSQQHVNDSWILARTLLKFFVVSPAGQFIAAATCAI